MNFSQVHRQFLWANYHAKYFLSLATRVLSKIAVINVIHDLNIFFAFNIPLEKLKLIQLYVQQVSMHIPPIDRVSFQKCIKTKYINIKLI